VPRLGLHGPGRTFAWIQSGVRSELKAEGTGTGAGAGVCDGVMPEPPAVFLEEAVARKGLAGQSIKVWGMEYVFLEYA
jgi:hypothetical protein